MIDLSYSVDGAILCDLADNYVFEFLPHKK